MDTTWLSKSQNLCPVHTVQYNFLSLGCCFVDVTMNTLCKQLQMSLNFSPGEIPAKYRFLRKINTRAVYSVTFFLLKCIGGCFCAVSAEKKRNKRKISFSQIILSGLKSHNVLCNYIWAPMVLKRITIICFSHNIDGFNAVFSMTQFAVAWWPNQKYLHQI